MTRLTRRDVEVDWIVNSLRVAAGAKCECGYRLHMLATGQLVCRRCRSREFILAAWRDADERR